MLARTRLPSALAGSHPARRNFPAAVEAAHELHEHRPEPRTVRKERLQDTQVLTLESCGQLT
jgi:hypothetical protein